MLKVFLGKLLLEKKFKTTIDKRINVSTYYQRRACNDRKRQRKQKATHITAIIKRLVTDFIIHNLYCH